MNQPLVSVIIPSYNVSQYLTDACESVLSQTYPNWEAIIVNDGSKDNTENIALSYCEKDTRFKYIYQENKGLSAARKTGIDAAQGDYIQFLDADDILLPKRLERMINAYQMYPSNVILYSGYYIGKNNEVYNERINPRCPLTMGEDITAEVMYKGFGNMFLFIPACPLFRKKIFHKIAYDITLRSAEDWDLYISICSQPAVFHCITDKLIVYRENPTSLSKNYQQMLDSIAVVTYKWRHLSQTKYYYIKRIANNTIYYWIKSLKTIKKANIFSVVNLFNACEKQIYLWYILLAVLRNSIVICKVKLIKLIRK